MDTFVIRITPRRIERLISLLIIFFFIFTSGYYANKYYDTTAEDTGYLDKVFSGTFFADVPASAPSSSDNSNNETNITTIIEDDEGTSITLAGNSTPENSTSDNETDNSAGDEDPEDGGQDAEEEEETEPASCTLSDNKVISFDTERNDDIENRYGFVESIRLSFCNTDDEENYMGAAVYFWDEQDSDYGLLDIRKSNPYFTTDATPELEPDSGAYTRTYTFETPRPIWGGDEFSYNVKFYYADSEGEKIETGNVRDVSSIYTLT